MSGKQWPTTAIRKRVCPIRAAIMIAAALGILIAGTSGEVHAQVGVPSVTSITPSSGPATGGTSVTISGANFTGATAVSFGGTAAAAFTVDGTGQITATSPAGTGTVDITVTTPGGTSATSAADQFTFVAAPTVTNVNPGTGPPGGGTSVTITGTNFTGATAVAFGGNQAGSFTVNSASQITATSPAGTGTVNVTVTTAGGTSATSTADQFTYAATGTTTTLSSSQNPSSYGQSVTFKASVSGSSPTGTVTFFDGATQIGTATLTAGAASLTTSSLAVGSHSITAQYGGDNNNATGVSAALVQNVDVPADSTNLRALQVSTTPVIAHISAQAVIGAVEGAIDAGFSDNPQPLTPNGAGFTIRFPFGQPAAPVTRRIRSGTTRRTTAGNGSLANGRQGGNGAPPGVRLIDMPVIPLPPGSGMPPPGETRFAPDQVVVQFAAGTTPQQIAGVAQRFGLTVIEQQTAGMLGRTVYVFQIANGQSVRQVIGRVNAAGIRAAVQPNYNYGLTQDRNRSGAGGAASAQYILNKLQLGEAHRITAGDNVVIAVIDSQIDFAQPNLAGAVTGRYDAGCGAGPPDSHGTGMAGAIAARAELLGVAPRARIMAICAFGGASQTQSSSFKVIKGLDYAIQNGARIVNMSFAGPADPALSQALQIAREKGILVVAAAGNNGPKAPPAWPGADPSVMAVTATDAGDRLLKAANQGKYVTIAAPGVDVLVPAPGGSVQLTTGTSVATAIVSGVAALLLARKPSLKPEEVRAILVETARHLGSPGINSQFGAGLVDPLKALDWVISGKSASRQESFDRAMASSDAGNRRVEDGFTALAYATQADATTGALPDARSRDWIAWADVRGINIDRNTTGNDLKGGQINAIAGLTHRLTPDLLVGILGGYEHFDYSSDSVNGVLKGDGWTAGAYFGWRFAQNLRFDAATAWSYILADNVAGTASGDFTGHRWLINAGLTGTWRWQSLVFQPSARIYALWEHENGYTDSLGTVQGDRNFATGRASGGVKVSYPFVWSDAVNATPYLGLYGDYYFSRDDAAATGLTTVPLLEGGSARATGGVVLTFDGGAQLAAGGEYGGIGSDVQIWSWRVRGSLPF